MTTATHQTVDALTTPQVAAAAGVPEWQLRAAVRRGLIAPPAKVGPMMLWRAADLDRVRQGLIDAGYLPAGLEDHHR